METSGLNLHLLYGQPFAIAPNDCFANKKSLENPKRIQSSSGQMYPQKTGTTQLSPRTYTISKTSYWFPAESITNLYVAKLSYREC